VEFDWDPAKAASNLVKHGIDFADAIEVLNDPRHVERADPGSRGEQRFQAIGMAKGRILFASFTMRAQVCRVISVRRASRRERATYTLQTGY
jgi:uncharacterized DUF497 family protein